MTPLGKNQLARLKTLGPHLCCIVGDKQLRGLQSRGLAEALGEDKDSFYIITPNGLRALADAIDGGKLPRTKLDDFKLNDRKPFRSQGVT